MGIFHGRGLMQGEGERPYDRTRHLPAPSGERHVGARPLHETLTHAKCMCSCPRQSVPCQG